MITGAFRYLGRTVKKVRNQVSVSPPTLQGIMSSISLEGYSAALVPEDPMAMPMTTRKSKPRIALLIILFIIMIHLL